MPSTVYLIPIPFPMILHPGQPLVGVRFFTNLIFLPIMSNILTSTWLLIISVYATKVYIGYTLIKNNDSVLNEELFPKGLISIFHLRILNLKKLRANHKMNLLGLGFNILTYVLYSLLVVIFFVLFFQEIIIID